MITKKVLFIDDGSVSEIVEKLRRILKKQGITLIAEVLNLKDPKFRKQNPQNEEETLLDITIIKQELEESFMNVKYDYVACDFNFNDVSLNGFRLIRWLINVSKSTKKRIRNAKYSLYSSERDKSIKETFSEDELGLLVKLKLEDFYDRSRISEELAYAIINNEKELDLKQKLINELDRYKEMKFQSVYPKFKDYSIAQILHEIEQDSFHGRGFQETFVELIIAHIISLNDE